ncbi:MAG: hypothetical protein LUE24_03015 [Lachnospiraceae bacterium]|nr:hypothetical protein [Lachnospiraceae bacterium]MCD8196130.1 hypothetical protein [Lachnospiraceae bacterium]
MFKHGYNRPENLWKDFTVERKTEAVNSRGRAVDAYDTENPRYIHAILCGASTTEKLAYSQAEHPITHTISHKGKPVAKAGDRLILRNRAFYIQSLDDPGDLGLWTLYYCEERSDTHDGNGLE